MTFLWNWLNPARFFSKSKVVFGFFLGGHVGGAHAKKDIEGEEDEKKTKKKKKKKQKKMRQKKKKKKKKRKNK